MGKFVFNHKLLATLAGLMLVACSEDTVVDPIAPITPPVTSQELGDTANPTGQPTSFDDDSFFLTIGKYLITKTDAKAGRTRELLDPPTGVEYIGPADIVGDYWVASTDTNYFVMHNVNTGEFAGEAYMGGRNSVFELASAVVCADTMCYVMNNLYDLLAYEIFPDSGSGILRWDKPIFDHEAKDRDLNIAQIVVAKDHIYVAGDMDEEGTTSIWAINRFTQRIDKTVKINSPLYGTPLVTGTRIIVPVSDALVALDIETFQSQWVTAFFGENGFYRTGTPSIAGSVVAFSSFALTNPNDEDSVRRRYVGVDVNTGSILWSTDAGEADGFEFAPQSNGVNFFGAISEYYSPLGYRNPRGKPIAIDANTGREFWRHDNNVENVPLAVGNQVYFVDMFGYEGLVGLSATTGQVVYDARGSTGSFPETPAM